MKKTFKISRANRMDNRLNLRTVSRNILISAFILLWGISVQAQDTLVVRGQILNGSGDPVSNVSVGVEKSFELPSVTNEQGEFSVKVLTGREWLSINPTSDFKEMRVFLNNRTELTIYLTREDLTSGYDQLTVLSQPILKRNMAFAYSELNTDDIIHSPVVSVDQYMQGRVPGMYVLNRSGDFGAGLLLYYAGLIR
jgi:hypothetical protein